MRRSCSKLWDDGQPPRAKTTYTAKNLDCREKMDGDVCEAATATACGRVHPELACIDEADSNTEWRAGAGQRSTVYSRPQAHMRDRGNAWGPAKKRWENTRGGVRGIYASIRDRNGGDVRTAGACTEYKLRGRGA